MGHVRPPAVVIVARHGARLDAADAQWHLTSPTPYDPPLTYGGWRQSQALGARIASIIQYRADASDESRSHRGGVEADGHSIHRSQRFGRRKHKFVIHTSPFLRCVQTSIAIAAGMKQHPAILKAESNHVYPDSHTLYSGSPHIRATDHWNSPHLPAIPEPKESSSKWPNGTLVTSGSEGKILLRIDAFLGEWLSPDYYENITPPPESKMMVAGAKANLLHHEEITEVAHSSESRGASRGNFPGGWGSGDTTPIQQTKDDSSPSDMSTPSRGIKNERANSHHIVSYGQNPSQQALGRPNSHQRYGSSGYRPPSPSYAISNSQPIPQGYIAHARDACTEADFQWDSLKPPLEWGTGGEYGEEWSSMHKRFRRGLQHMCAWYQKHGLDEEPGVMHEGPVSHCEGSQVSEGADDDETDTVVVLVTHGAGCNALIGALTNQPVLIDVAMASLTMAIRKSVEYRRLPRPDGSPVSPSRRRRSFMDSSTAEDYDVKLIASTDHLRSGAQSFAPSTRSRSPSLPVREKSPYRYERQVKNPHVKSRPSREDTNANSPISSPKVVNFGGIQRSATAAVASTGGLWSKPVPKQAENDEQDANSEEVSNSHEIAVQKEDVLSPIYKSMNLEDESEGAGELPTNSKVNDDNGRTLEPQGLWGTAPLALAAERDRGAKRRWTLSQASQCS